MLLLGSTVPAINITKSLTDRSDRRLHAVTSIVQPVPDLVSTTLVVVRSVAMIELSELQLEVLRELIRAAFLNDFTETGMFDEYSELSGWSTNQIESVLKNIYEKL